MNPTSQGPPSFFSAPANAERTNGGEMWREKMSIRKAPYFYEAFLIRIIKLFGRRGVPLHLF